jgi:hypothetical protein
LLRQTDSAEIAGKAPPATPFLAPIAICDRFDIVREPDLLGLGVALAGRKTARRSGHVKVQPSGGYDMSKVIQFLEAMGSTSASARLSDTEYADAISTLDIDPAQRQALLNRDHSALSNLLGGRATMFFGLVPAENDEPEDDPEKEDEAPEQEIRVA